MLINVLEMIEATIAAAAKASEVKPFQLESKQVPVMRCFATSGNDHKGAFRPPEEMHVVKSEGWELVTTENGKFKPGWVARTPGSVLHISLEMAFGDSGQLVEGQPIFIELTYLNSYEHMGSASLSCFSGCSCGNKTVDAFTPELSFSSPFSTVLRAYQPKSRCIIQVRGTEA